MRRFGATTFVIEKGLDTGPILGSVTLAIGPTDTTGDLLDLLAEVGSSLLIETLDGLDAGGLTPIAQGNEGVSLAPKLQPIDARIVWSQPLAGIDRLIRATTPNPGSWTTLGGERVKIAPLDNSVLWPGKDPRPGHIEILDGRVWVGTDSFPAALTQVQPAGKKLMDAADWLSGLRSMSPAFD